MEFLKNNWGFLLLAIILCGAIVTCSVFCVSANNELTKQRADVKSKTDYLNSVAKKNIKLSDEDVEIAQRTQKVAEQGIASLKNDIKTRFKLEYEVPETEIEALRVLKDELSKMRKMLDEKEIDYAQDVEYFTFEDIATSTQPPNKDDLPQIFRQLTIVKHMVDVAAKAEVESIESIERPMGLAVPEEGIYSFTPIEIKFYANSEKAQRFINLMSKADKFLFFLSYLEFYGYDETTDIAADIEDTAINAPSSQQRGKERGPGMGGMVSLEPRSGGRSGGRKGGMVEVSAMEDLLNGGRRGSRGRNARAGRLDEEEEGKSGKIRRRGTRINSGLGGSLGGVSVGNPLDAGLGGMGNPLDSALGGGMGIGMQSNRKLSGNDLMRSRGYDPDLVSEDELYEIPQRRQDLLVYDEKVSLWTLRYDLIEFIQNEEEASTEESSDFAASEDAEPEDAEEEQDTENAE